MANSQTTRGYTSYLDPIEIGQNQSALYLNEVCYKTTQAWRKNKEVQSTVSSPYLYNIAQKILRNDNRITIISNEAIKAE